MQGGQGFGTASGGFLNSPPCINQTRQGPAAGPGWEGMPTIPTVPTDAYRCPQMPTGNLRASAVDFLGGVLVWQAGGPASRGGPLPHLRCVY